MNIDELEQALRCKFPESIALVLSQQAPVVDEFRLMPPAESASTNQKLEFIPLPSEARILWTNDEGLFAGMYMHGPLGGMVFGIDREGDDSDCSPYYRTADSFFRHAAAGVCEAWENGWRHSTDYPKLGFESVQSGTPLDTAFDSSVGNELRKNATSEHSVLCAMSVSPRSEANGLLEYLASENARIRSKACRILGFHQVKAAIPKLHAAALEDHYEVSRSAMIGLGLMKSADGVEAILDAAANSPTCSRLAPAALRHGGFVVRRADGVWMFKHPDHELWLKMPFPERSEPLR